MPQSPPPDRRIEDYALIGDTQTAALLDRSGSIDWVCFPRFDSGACFASLLGDRGNGRWQIAPAGEVRAVRRRYRGETLVLETELDTDQGTVRLIDFMPVRGERPDIVRLVEGVAGAVSMKVDLVVRFDTGRVVPWVRRRDGALTFTAGPDALCLRSDVGVRGEGFSTVAEFEIRAGERRAMTLTWFPSHHRVLPERVDPLRALKETEQWWRAWSAKCTYEGPWREAVGTSLRLLKALTFGPTGGIVAAPTTSLPEWLGSSRNWDYRYCWLRDATLTLYALMLGGYRAEAVAWREWLLRAAAGDPSGLQIMYGVGGEQRLPEYEAPWLPGFAGSKPVRLGNAAHEQLQLDVFGEVNDTFYQARRLGIAPDPWSWSLEIHAPGVAGEALAPAGPRDLGDARRAPPLHALQGHGLGGLRPGHQIGSLLRPPGTGRALARDTRRRFTPRSARAGYDQARGIFTRSYGEAEVDASLLHIPLVGFLPADDPRVAATLRAVERDLLQDGFVMRYRTHDQDADGLPPGEGAFLPCSFWLADAYVQAGRREEACRLFGRLLEVRNDVGLLSEEYDPRSGRLLGNFPQAFSHLCLINTAYNLTTTPERPAQHRNEGVPIP